VAAVADRAVQAVELIVSGREENIVDSAVKFFLNRQYGVDTLALAVKYTPGRREFGLGKDYLTLPSQLLIPRALWPEKPILNITADFEETYAVGWRDSYSSPHLISNLYSNFHLFGIIAGLFFFGAGLRRLYSYCRPWVGYPAAVCVYAILLPGLVHSMEWEPVTICIYYIRFGVFLFVLVHFVDSKNALTGVAKVERYCGSFRSQKRMLKQSSPE
jgi:hypothetical protein